MTADQDPRVEAVARTLCEIDGWSGFHILRATRQEQYRTTARAALAAADAVAVRDTAPRGQPDAWAVDDGVALLSAGTGENGHRVANRLAGKVGGIVVPPYRHPATGGTT